MRARAVTLRMPYERLAMLLRVSILLFALVGAAAPLPQRVGDPVSAIQGLVGRILGTGYVDQFEYEVISDEGGYDVFEVDSDAQKGKPVLRGNSGVALGSALNFYLKAINCSISWGRDGTGDQLSLPHPLPLPTSKLRVVSPVKYRYYQNVCTVSYSMAWWDFTRWQREIDWMAMNGLNLILSFTGQEYVWQKFYTSLGLTDTEIKAFFSGAAFLAWQRMGNLRGWGGPLDDGWIASQAEVQKKVVASIREFGMINVLPGFAGHVPAGLKRVYPSANYTRNSGWGNFNETYTEDYLLEPTDPLFVELGEKYYQVLISEFGNDHIFNADTYNEMNPSSTDLNFLAETNEAIYNAMASVDKDAVFLMQGWLFHSGFWTNDRIKAFLSKVPNDKMIILDLNSEVSPIWSRTDSYFGKPFIWCLLHNYGGTRAIYGNLTRIGTGPIEAKKTPGNTMVGVGMTPEAIEHNPIVYDLMGEMSWRSEEVTDIPTWVLRYATRRYGAKNYVNGVREAWLLLLQSVYQFHWSWDIKSIVDRAPEFVMASDLRFNATGIAQAWKLIVTAAVSKQLNTSVGPLRYDMVDIGRQTLVNIFVDLHTMYMLAYNKLGKGASPITELTSISSAMLQLLVDLDALLGSDTNFLLGHWIADARGSAPSGSSADVLANLEFNARNQVTMWGPHQNIEDYASKEWSGLVKDYYWGRWQLFTGMVNDAVKSGQPLNQSVYEDARFKLEANFSQETKTYPVQPVGDTVQISGSILKAYFRNSSYISTHFTAYPGKDITAANSDLFAGNGPWSRLLDQVARLCEVNPTCVGFNSHGVLRNGTATPVSSPGTTLYMKKTFV